MACGILFCAVDRVIPTLEDYRAALTAPGGPVARSQAAMDADPWTDEQIAAFRQDEEDRGRYLFAKSVLAHPSRKGRTPQQVAQMEAFVAAVEGDPVRLLRLTGLPNHGPRIETFLMHRRYVRQGPASMGDAGLAQFLAEKRAISPMRHDPIEAFPLERIGPDCREPSQYVVIFDGLDKAAADTFCVPGTDRYRDFRLAFATLPASARQAIQNQLVPTVTWQASFMVAKSGGAIRNG